LTFCTGCNVLLSRWKKYNFQKQWRVPGYFCKECMKKIGQDWNDHGRITLSKRVCDLCEQNFFFLTTTTKNKHRYHCCNICKDLDYTESSKDMPPIPPRIPMTMAIFASFGILLMIAGFAYVTLFAPQQDFNILHVLLGGCMSGAGFMLARKMVKVRNLIMCKNP